MIGRNSKLVSGDDGRTNWNEVLSLTSDQWRDVWRHRVGKKHSTPLLWLNFCERPLSWSFLGFFLPQTHFHTKSVESLLSQTVYFRNFLGLSPVRENLSCCQEESPTRDVTTLYWQMKKSHRRWDWSVSVPGSVYTSSSKFQDIVIAETLVSDWSDLK